MKRHYTYATLYGNDVLCRGWDEKEGYFNRKYKYKPTFYLKTDKPSRYKTLEGDNVSPIQPGTIKESKAFLQDYNNVGGVTVYGMDRILYQFLSEEFDGEVNYEPKKIKLWSLDIETAAENGFPNVRYADQEILLISLKNFHTKKIVTFGCGDFNTIDSSIQYVHCDTETHLLRSFLKWWKDEDPEVITGWNCVPTSSNIWGKTSIHKMNSMKPNTELYDSNVVRVSSVSSKLGVTQKLANGARITSSYDHIFPYTLCPGDNYTKLTGKIKNKEYHQDLCVRDAITNKDEKFVFVPIRKNNNVDNPSFSDAQCYLLGLIYTDGTLKSKDNITWGFTFYQSDIDFITEVKETYNIPTKIVGPYKDCFYLHIPFKHIKHSSAIYEANNKKKLNVELLSTLSERQFYLFLSGLLDGDGFVSSHSIGFCNYNDDINSLYELCLWNGIFSTITKDRLYFIEIDYSKLELKKDKRWSKLSYKDKLLRDSSQKAKQIRFKKADTGYYVRVVDFIETVDMDMMDIETDTHYFVSSGVKTHNCVGFDIPYICNRLNRILGEDTSKLLSPWKFVIESEVEVHNKKVQKFDIVGVSVLDYLEAYQKFTYTNRENYRLDTIAEIELGENKLDHSEYDTFSEFYKNNWQKFTEYNIHDVNLVDRLEEKMKLIDLIMLMAYDAHCNYQDTFSQVKLWDVIIYNFLKKKDIVLSPTIRSDKNSQYEGAYVKEPVPGGYDWVCNFDLNSLYPSLIRFLNISPETLVQNTKVPVSVDSLITKSITIPKEYSDYTVAANGCLYRKDKLGFMAELVSQIYSERVEYKNRMIECQRKYQKTPTNELSQQISKWSNFQMARKIQLNSLYGALGNQYFRHYRVDNAEAITLTGQVAIRWIERKLNEYLNKVLTTTDKDYVIAVDTDSVYLNLGPVIKSVFKDKMPDKTKIVDILDSFCADKITPFIDSGYHELYEYLQAYEPVLIMKREAIAEKGIWTAKKRYILNVWDNEGVRYEKPKLKMMGIEAVKSSTPSPCRKYIKECLQIVMGGTEKELIDYISEKREEYKQLSIYDIAFPRTANNISKFISYSDLYVKSTPIHVRAAIMHNHLLKEKNLTHKYNKIMDGEKIRYVILQIPNPTHENVIAFISDFPEEFGLTNWIDHDTMFEKGFIAPLQSILNSIGWKTQEVSTLESFFN